MPIPTLSKDNSEVYYGDIPSSLRWLQMHKKSVCIWITKFDWWFVKQILVYYLSEYRKAKNICQIYDHRYNSKQLLSECSSIYGNIYTKEKCSTKLAFCLIRWLEKVLKSKVGLSVQLCVLLRDLFNLYCLLIRPCQCSLLTCWVFFNQDTKKRKYYWKYNLNFLKFLHFYLCLVLWGLLHFCLMIIVIQ